MLSTIQTPGVYIQELNAFPDGIIPVPTAVTAFIGYTEKAVNGINAVRISSLAECEQQFGKGPVGFMQFTIRATAAGAVSKPLQPVITIAEKNYLVERASAAFYLYHSIALFFANGGADCYIISVGDYSKTPSLADLSAGLDILTKEPEPTILVIPDAVALSAADHAMLVQQSLAHCETTQQRVAIVDIHDGAVSDPSEVDAVIDDFRKGTGNTGLSYGAAYFPWLVTGIAVRSEISFVNLPEDLADYLENTPAVTEALKPLPALCLAFSKDPANPLITQQIQDANTALLSVSKQYYELVSAALQILNILPPSAAMAGIYALQDAMYTVSKAPANVTLAAVLSPTVNLTDQQQMSLNVHASGKSVNALRAFQMKGVVAWGAKTLDDHEVFFRYINVRRTMMFIEQSIKLGLRSFVFAPNVADTWVTIKNTIENFLFGFWKSGGLAGSIPADAYVVEVGLGSTMSEEDILYGFLRVTVLIAVSHPGEFIEISFEQQMQRS